MSDPNRAFKDKDKPDTIDVRHLYSTLKTCAECGRPVLIELRGVDTLYLPGIRCVICRRGGEPDPLYSYKPFGTKDIPEGGIP